MNDTLCRKNKHRKIIQIVIHNQYFILMETAVTQSADHSTPDRRARVRVLPGDTPPYTLMAPVECKLRRGCNVLPVPTQIMQGG